MPWQRNAQNQFIGALWCCRIVRGLFERNKHFKSHEVHGCPIVLYTVPHYLSILSPLVFFSIVSCFTLVTQEAYHGFVINGLDLKLYKLASRVLMGVMFHIVGKYLLGTGYVCKSFKNNICHDCCFCFFLFDRFQKYFSFLVYYCELFCIFKTSNMFNLDSLCDEWWCYNDVTLVQVSLGC